MTKKSQKSIAQGHGRTHTGEKPFLVDTAIKDLYNRKDTLKNHNERRHTEEKTL